MRHGKKRLHRLRIVGEVDQDLEVTKRIKITAARICILRHRRESVANVVKRHSQLFGQRSSSERVGDIVPGGASQRNGNLTGATNQFAIGAVEAHEIITLINERQTPVFRMLPDDRIVFIETEPDDGAGELRGLTDQQFVIGIQNQHTRRSNRVADNPFDIQQFLETL